MVNDLFFLFIIIVGAILIINWVIFVALIILVNEAISLSIWNCFRIEKVHIALDFGKEEASILIVKNGDMRADITEYFLSFFKEKKILILLLTIFHGFDECEMSI